MTDIVQDHTIRKAHMAEAITRILYCTYNRYLLISSLFKARFAGRIGGDIWLQYFVDISSTKYQQNIAYQQKGK